MLWLLRRREHLPRDRDPWRRRDGGDFIAAIIVREPDEAAARRRAQDLGGSEVDEWHFARGVDVNAWLDPKYSTCEPLPIEGPPGLVFRELRRTYGFDEEDNWDPADDERPVL